MERSPILSGRLLEDPVDRTAEKIAAELEAVRIEIIDELRKSPILSKGLLEKNATEKLIAEIEAVKAQMIKEKSAVGEFDDTLIMNGNWDPGQSDVDMVPNSAVIRVREEEKYRGPSATSRTQYISAAE